MKQALVYTFKIGLTVLLIVPCIVLFYQSLSGGEYTQYTFTGAGGIKSFFAVLLIRYVCIWLVLSVFVFYTIRWVKNAFFRKSIILIAALILSIFLIHLPSPGVFFSPVFVFFDWDVIYLIVLSLSVYLYKLKTV